MTKGNPGEPREQQRKWRPRIRGRWQELAECSEFPDFTEWQDRETSKAAKKLAVREQKKVCARCPVRGECLERALATHPDGQFGGMWGGLTDDELRAILRKQRKARREQLRMVS